MADFPYAETGRAVWIPFGTMNPSESGPWDTGEIATDSMGLALI